MVESHPNDDHNAIIMYFDCMSYFSLIPPPFLIGGRSQVQGHPQLTFAIIRLVPVIYLTEFAFT